jgi:hypothetical protein
MKIVRQPGGDPGDQPRLYRRQLYQRPCRHQ